MSLRLRRIALSDFRKFRDPISIDGLTDGLNIVIECNEAGKSTVLDALRAAFFVRHNTRNQLALSYAPYGDSVGPEISVEFEAAGAPWSVKKRFLRNPSVEVTGPQGRAQGDEAEARLNTLFDSVRDSSRAGDVSTYGALGLLWVAQSEALSVSAPGQIVRDSVASTLEAEVGAIMGGPAYKRVRTRIDDQFGGYWTPTGQKRGRQVEARERSEAADTATQEASARLVALETTFAELDAARNRLKVVDRDIADETDSEARKDLIDILEVARAAAQILATRTAEQEAATAKARSLTDLQLRHEQATAERASAESALATSRQQRSEIAEKLEAARQRVTNARADLDLARTARQTARLALSAGEEHQRARQRTSAIGAARQRHSELFVLEGEWREAKKLADTQIATDLISALEAHDRAVAESRAALNAGAAHITFRGSTAGITIDGDAIELGERALVRPATIRLGEAELIVTPPTSAGSASASLEIALSSQRLALEECDVESTSAARLRNDIARDATANIRTLEARMLATTPADSVIDLLAGAEALKLFVADLDDDVSEGGEVPDLTVLKKEMDEAEESLARAEGLQESAVDALRQAEAEDGPLAIAVAGAESDLSNLTANVNTIEHRPEFPTLENDLAKARERAAEASVRLEEATSNATAYDPVAIMKKIEIIDARGRTATETRNKLVTAIARLENTVEIEGGSGLADLAAAAQEEMEAAATALQRVTLEAETLKLLRNTLDEARNETAAKFVGPVAKRAKRHIERLLPGCELTFSEELALITVARSGVPETCGNLSKGTQEQLAVLTRIAFADILLEQGKPVSLILDDPLVYSDDSRLDLMIEIISEAATRMQVILLTCRDRAFRHVAGNRISIASHDS